MFLYKKVRDTTINSRPIKTNDFDVEAVEKRQGGKSRVRICIALCTHTLYAVKRDRRRW